MKKNTKSNCLVSAIILSLAITISLFARIAVKSLKSDKQIFTDIYNNRCWGGWNGVGPGSTTEDGALPFLNYLQEFIDSHSDINTVVDMGCGYGELLKNIRFSPNTKYLGLDIVDSVIEYNKKHYVRDNFSFATVNKLEDLTKYHGDLLILKDVIQHWTTEQILYAKEHIIPNFKYAIIVNNIRTTYLTHVNSSIKTGDSRPLDLKAYPFFMKPAHIQDYKLPPYRTKRIHLFINER